MVRTLRTRRPGACLVAKDGAAPNVAVQRPDDEKRWSCLKVNGIKVGKGTVIKSLTGGGGGYGPAVERDPEAVRQDVDRRLRV